MMNAEYTVVVGATVAANAAIGFAGLAKADFVAKTSAEVGVSSSWLPLLGGLKLAGAAGLLLELVGIRWIGIPAAAGLVVFFVGALVAHVRARVFYNIAFPALFLAFAVASLLLSLSNQ